MASAVTPGARARPTGGPEPGAVDLGRRGEPAAAPASASGWAAAYRGRRVAVLGAAGFIGRWVARLLGASGAILHLGVRDVGAAARVFDRYAVAGTIHPIECMDPRTVQDFLAAVRPTVAFNLVSYGVDATERDEPTAYAINVAAVRAITATLAAGPRDASWPGQELVHAGSALEYGPVGGHLAEEGPARPDTLYGRTKLEGTQAVADACATGRLRGVTGRLFTVYGPGERPVRLLPSLLQAARTGHRLPLTAGAQRRDFTYVADAAEGLLRLGVSAAPPGAVVNVATGRLRPVREFVETAAAILGIAPEALAFGALPTRAEEMDHAGVDLRRLRALTGWTPVISVADGIRRTVAFEGGADR